MAALADPDRGWDAIVIGEYERAFYGSQYAGITLTYDPDTSTLCTGGSSIAAVTVGKDR